MNDLKLPAAVDIGTDFAAWAEHRPRKSRSWLATIAEQRDQLDDLFEMSPSLRPLVPEVLPGCYAR